MKPLRVGGLTALTSIDFPGRLAAVVFLQGCPWRCGYCHNPALIPADAPVTLAWDAVLAFLKGRRGLLDGVVFSGGEPTLQPGLDEAVAQVRQLGFEVGLHTAGMYPERLASVLPSLDWVGLDVKAPWDGYDGVTGVRGSGSKARAALAHLLASGVAHECRTTWHPGLFSAQRLEEMAAGLADLGVRQWVVQPCRQVPGSPAPALDDARLRRLGARFEHFCVR